MLHWLILTATAQDGPDFRDHVEQAKFYLRKEWYNDARSELETAVAYEDGRLDAEAWFLLAQTNYTLGDLAGARYAADRAYVHSRTQSEEEQSRELSMHLSQAFGLLTLTPPRESVTTELTFELRSRILDPELKRWIARAQEQLQGSVTLPLTIGLPAGGYTINSVEVHIPGGEHVYVSPPIEGRGLALQTLRVEMSTGMSVWFGSATESMLPAITTGLTLGLPVGPVEFAVVGDWTPRAIALASGQVVADLAGVAGGLRIGLELPGDESLRIRPALSWRYGLVPGVETPCARGASGGWTCRDGAAAAEILVVPRSLTHRPAAEIAATWLPRDRKSGFGLGLRLAGEAAFGQLPKEATAKVVSSNESIPYKVVDRRWSAFGLRTLLDLTYAF